MTSDFPVGNIAIDKETCAREFLERKQIRNSLSRWCEFNGFKPAKHHRLIIEKLEAVARGDILRLALFLPPGSAKALALDTPIPTPQGWKAMGCLRVGDQVFDEKGYPCEVTWVSPIWKNRPVYSVTTDCGDEIVADADHEWLVRLCGKRQIFRIKQTRTLCRTRLKRPMIERAKALVLPEVDLPIDPYLLGVWLGDGHAAGIRITSSLEDQPWLRQQIERSGYRTHDHANATQFGISHLRAVFVRLGLLNDAAHKTFGKKYVPHVYLRASASQRLALLQGLIDTDGTVSRQTGCTTFSNTNRNLADGVAELVRSLGVKCSVRENRARLYGKDYGPVYRVTFYLGQSACLPCKAQRTRNQQRTPNAYIEVKPAGIADTICIEVNSPSHLFLCGRSMLPTHNSTYTSVLFPPWLLNQDPKALILAASHTTELAERWGRRVRNIIADNNLVLSIRLSDDNQAANRWSIQGGGEYYAAGANVGIAGFRASYGLIDDPIRSRQDADSQLVRDRLWDWYLNDFRPRLVPGARQVIISTRWHVDDLAGRVLNHEPWDVVSLPALAKADDALGRDVDEPLWCDDDYGYGAQLLGLRDTTPPRVWSALYQQAPAPDEGDYFREEWLKPRDIIPHPSTLRVYGGSDYAVTSDGGDYTVHAVVGVDHLNNMYLLDVWRRQASSDVWIDGFCDLVQKYRPLEWAEEGGQIKSGVGPFLEKRMRERRVYVNRRCFTSRGDKAVRARSIQGRMALDGLYYPKNANWVSDFLAEILQFPATKYDDTVDALSLVGQLLDIMVLGKARKNAIPTLPEDGYQPKKIKTPDMMTL